MARQKPSNSKHVLYTTQSRPKKRQGPASSPVGNGSLEQSTSSSSVNASRRPENNSPVEGAGTVELLYSATGPASCPAIDTDQTSHVDSDKSDQILMPLDLTPVNRQEATASASSINSPAALTCMEQIKQFFAT